MPTQPTTPIESVGSLLRGARLERGLSTAAVAERLHLSEGHLIAFESDEHWRLPDDAYTRVYLRAYAEYLGFSGPTLVRQYYKERGRHVPERLSANARPAREISSWMLLVTPRLMQAVFVGAIALAVTGYFGYELKRMVAPPAIVLSSPTDGFVTHDRSITVEGRTEREVIVSVNGKSVSPDSRGQFRDTLELQEGTNVITVRSSKKHSREVTVTRRVLVLPQERPAAMIYGPTRP